MNNFIIVGGKKHCSSLKANSTFIKVRRWSVLYSIVTTTIYCSPLQSSIEGIGDDYHKTGQLSFSL